jgi:NitT/TauT family transport system substrate-binding protein
MTPLSRAQAIGSAAGAALAAAFPRGVRAQSLKTVRVGSSLDDGITPLLYGMHAGLFANAGLDIELQGSTSGAALAQAVAGGTIDIAKTALMSLISAYARGVEFKIIAGAALNSDSEPPTVLCVLRDSPIHTAADLNGKTIAVNALQSLDVIGTELALDQHGGNSASVKFVEIPTTTMAVALEQGRADMAAITNPALADALASGKIRTFAAPYSAISPHLLIAGWFSTADYAAHNPDVVTKFRAVMRQAAAYGNAHHAETAPLLADYGHLDPAVVARMNRFVYPTSLDAALIQPAIDAAVKYKVIDHGFSAADLIAKE